MLLLNFANSLSGKINLIRFNLISTDSYRELDAIQFKKKSYSKKDMKTDIANTSNLLCTVLW